MSCCESAHVSQAEHVRQRIRRDLSRWSRKLLLCLGLENIGKHIVGDSKWEKLYDGCPTSTPTTTSSSSAADQENDSTPDFDPQPEENDEGNKSATNPSLLHVNEEDDDEDEEDKKDATNQLEEPNDRNTPPNEKSCQRVEEEDECHEDIEEKGTGEHSPSPPPPNTTTTSTTIADANNNSSSVMEEEEGEHEEMDDEELNDSSPSTTPAPRPPPPLIQHLMEPPESPPSRGSSGGEQGAVPEEKGALVDNLFQILPYWYFLNRAFGMSAASGEGNSEAVDEDDDEDGEGSGGDFRSSGALSMGATGGSFGGANSLLDAASPSSSSSATQRLNSLLILETLRQQLQTNGQQGARGSDEPGLQQGLHLSELLSRMSGGGGGGGPWPMDERGDLRETEDQEIDDQPLDLTSTKTSSSRDDGRDTGISRRGGGGGGGGGDVGGFGERFRGESSPFILDEQTSKVFRSNPRSSKGYTAQELQAALHDIQSGKLGTRRAAVIYGIPRSTLRNKVYKLGKDRGRMFNNNSVSTAQNNNNNTAHHLNNNNNNNNSPPKLGGVGVGASLLGKLSYLQGLHPNYLKQQEGFDGGNLGGRGGAGKFATTTTTTTTATSGTDDESENGGSGHFLRNSSRHHQQQGHLHHHHVYAALNGSRGDMKEEQGRGGSPPKIPQSSLSQLISKHAQQQQQSAHNFQVLKKSSSASSMELGGEDDVHSSGLLKDWKYALAQHDQLLNHHHHQSTSRHESLSRVVGGGEVGGSSVLNHRHHHLNHLQHHHQQGQQGQGQHMGSDDPSSLDLAGKKSRPKRGKYRNYDREALVKAVKAVQNGEMSVHRAGSFFGVPHSTLEYKVKERHLLRRPKRKDVTSPISQAKSSSPENSSDASPLSRHAATTGPSADNLLKTPKLANNGGGGSSSSSSALHSLFPLTSDLRESLSRYLSAEQQERGSSSAGEWGSGSHNTSNNNNNVDLGSGSEEDEDLAPVSKASSRSRAEEGGSRALGLESLIGNRLSNLFQLNDILLRSSAGGGAAPGGGEERAESLLDLTKK